jgi:hypothetical protein
VAPAEPVPTVAGPDSEPDELAEAEAKPASPAAPPPETAADGFVPPKP